LTAIDRLCYTVVGETERGDTMLSAITSLVSVKTLIIIVTLLVIGFLGYVYINANGANLAWCTANINDCRIARVQALERNYEVLNPSK